MYEKREIIEKKLKERGEERGRGGKRERERERGGERERER